MYVFSHLCSDSASAKAEFSALQVILKFIDSLSNPLNFATMVSFAFSDMSSQKPVNEIDAIQFKENENVTETEEKESEKKKEHFSKVENSIRDVFAELPMEPTNEISFMKNSKSIQELPNISSPFECLNSKDCTSEEKIKLSLGNGDVSKPKFSRHKDPPRRLSLQHTIKLPSALGKLSK